MVLYRATHERATRLADASTTASAAVVSAPHQTDDGSPVTLSPVGKAPSRCWRGASAGTPNFEGAIARRLLLSFGSACRGHAPAVFSPPRAISPPPTLRVHLRFCVFRE